MSLPPQAPNPLIEAAVKTLSGNAEQRLTAISILTETANPKHPDTENVIRRWEKVDGKNHPFFWKPLLYLAAIVTAIPMVVIQIPDLKLAWEYRDMVDMWDGRTPDMHVPENLTTSQRLLIGDPEKSKFEQKEALYVSDPENPAYYSEYVEAYWAEYESLPPDYLETVSRIAPSNSYFFYLAAGMIARDTVEDKPLAPSTKPLGVSGILLSPPPTEVAWVVNNQAEFEKSLSFFEKASALPDYETYHETMLRARLNAVPDARTFAMRMNRSLLVYRGLSGLTAQLRAIAILSAQAQELSKSGDVDAFRKLSENREQYMRVRSAGSGSTLLGEIIFTGIASSSAEAFYFAAKRLGLAELSAKYLAESDAFKASNERRKIRGRDPDPEWISERGSPLSQYGLSLGLGITDSPPPLILADLGPTRYADHALAMRAGMAAVAFLLLVAALIVFHFRWCFPPALREIATRMVHLLRPVDWIIVIMLGTVLPLVFVLALQSFTAIGGREWSIEHFRYVFPTTDLFAIILLILFTPAFFIRWRLSRRITPLGIPCRPGIFSALAILAVLTLTLAAYLFVLKFGTSPWVIKVFSAVPTFCLCVVFWNLLQAVMGKTGQRISLAATTMALVPTYAVAIIFVSLTLPLFRASEENWLAKDTIHNLDLDAPDFGQYEFRLAAQKRRETRSILGMEK